MYKSLGYFIGCARCMLGFVGADTGSIISYANYARTQTVTIDTRKIQDHRIGQVNQLRQSISLSTYVPHSSLQKTAQFRSDRAKKLGVITHTRPGSQLYYSYPLILDRFARQGVMFSGSGTLFVENIGYGYLRCTKKDCTDELIQAIQSTRKFFLSEKNRKYQPHYRSMINPTYRLAGVGVSIDLDRRRYYLTAHYSQSLKSK